MNAPDRIASFECLFKFIIYLLFSFVNFERYILYFFQYLPPSIRGNETKKVKVKNVFLRIHLKLKKTFYFDSLNILSILFAFSDTFCSIQLYSCLFFLMDVIAFCLSFLNTDLTLINWFHDLQIKNTTLEDQKKYAWVKEKSILPWFKSSVLLGSGELQIHSFPKYPGE